MMFHVEVEPIGIKLHHLYIHYEGRRIGEYERSQFADIERKKYEVQCAKDALNKSAID